MRRANERAPLAGAASNIRRAMSKRAACNAHCPTSEQSCSTQRAMRRRGDRDAWRCAPPAVVASALRRRVVCGARHRRRVRSPGMRTHSHTPWSRGLTLSTTDLVTSAAAGEAARAVGGRHREAARPRARIGAAVGPKLDRFLAEHGASTTRELRPTFASCFAGCGRTHGVTMPSSSHRDGGLMLVLVVPYEAACPC